MHNAAACVFSNYDILILLLRDSEGKWGDVVGRYLRSSKLL
jgi:hypothetical protein